MDLAQLEKIAKALADETRLRVFEAISSKKNITCGGLVALQDVTPATISHHMRILADAGLIECRKQGQFVLSRVNPKIVAEYTAALARLAAGRKKTSRRN